MNQGGSFQPSIVGINELPRDGTLDLGRCIGRTSEDPKLFGTVGPDIGVGLDLALASSLSLCASRSGS